MENEKVKELRERFAKIQYAASLEKDLQQELDETKDLEKRISLTKRIEEVRETNNEAATTQIIEEAEKGQEEAENKIEQNRAKIETLKSRNKELEEREKAFTKEILENEGIMELKKANPSSKIYISAKEENEKLLKSKRAKLLQIKRNNNKIKKLEAEIESLEAEILDFDDFLSEIRGIEKEEIKQKENPQKEQGQEESKEEVQQQEDEMWEQYRLEQEKVEKEQEIRKQEEIDKAFDEKNFKEDSEEKIRDLLAYEDTQKWLDGDELLETSTTKIVQGLAPTTLATNQVKRPVITTHTTNQIKRPVATARTTNPVQGPVSTTPTTSSIKTPVSTATDTKPEPEVKTEDKDKCEIKQAGFRIQANGNPEYYVLFIKDGKLDIKYYEALSYINAKKQREFYKLKDVKKRIKYFDFGLKEILEDFDFTNKTNYVDKYIDSIIKNDTKVEDRGFKISYDFSNLSIYSLKNSQKLRYLRNIAKANKEAGLAEYYKPKNIFKRIESRIKNSKFYSKYFLPAPAEYETVKEPTNEQIKDSFEQLYDEPGFDIEVFAKQNNFSDKTASEYKKLQGKKGKEFRESLRTIKETKGTTIDPDFEDISRAVEEVKKEQNDKKEKSGWEI